MQQTSITWRKLMSFLGKRKGKYLLSALLLVLAVGFRALEPKILQIAVDNYIAPVDATDVDPVSNMLASFLPEGLVASLALLALAGMYIIISLFRGTTSFLAETMKSAVTQASSKDLRDEAFLHLQKVPLSYFGGITRGELIQRCTGDIDTIRGLFQGHLASILRLGALMVLALIMIAATDITYALLTILIGPVMLFVSMRFFKREGVVWKENEEESDRLNELIQENLNGIRLVSAYANEEFEIEKFKERNVAKRAASLKHNLLHTIFWSATDMLVFLQLTASMIIGGYFAITGKITVGELLSCYAYIGMVVWPIRHLGEILSQLKMAQVAAERMAEVMDAPVEDMTGFETTNILGNIRFENVSFRYGPEEPWALKDISFEINAGENIAISGPTGSGKTTMLRLLLRLYEPEQGQIFLDGRPLNNYSKTFLRQQMGIALQKPFLFSATLEENIAYARPDSPAELADKAMEMAQFSNSLAQFPDGLQTMVGEKGVTLSGGQKQRVALARTLLSHPDILMLDDITSAVDAHTEEAMLDALEKPLSGKTSIIISHRLTALRRADKVLILEEGQMTQIGSPAELSIIPGYYQDMTFIHTQASAN